MDMNGGRYSQRLCISCCSLSIRGRKQATLSGITWALAQSWNYPIEQNYDLCASMKLDRKRNVALVRSIKGKRESMEFQQKIFRIARRTALMSLIIFSARGGNLSEVLDQTEQVSRLFK